MWNSTLPIRRLGDLLQREKRSFQPNGEETYRLLGVRWYGQGCHIHDTYDGATLKAPVLTRLHPGDVVYNKMWASRGSFGVVSPDEDGTVATNEYPVFRSKGGLDTAYLRYVMQQPRFWGLAKAWSSGTTGRARLNPRDFLAMPVPIPSLEEQRAITGILGAVDDTIRETEAYLDQLRVAKHQVMRQLLACGLPGRHSKFEPNAIGPLPADWSVAWVGDLLKRIEAGRSPKCEGRPAREGEWGVLKVSAVTWGDFRPHENKAVLSQEDRNPAYQVRAGDLLMTRANTASLAGAVALVHCTPPRLMLCDKTWRLVPNEKLIRRDYLLHSLRGRHARRFLELEATGSSCSMKNISQSSLRSLRLPVPPLDEQREIADVGESFSQRLVGEVEVLEQLREVKRALAQALLTGRVQVPNDGSGDGAEGGA